jgi:hypothetical protein
MEFLIFHFFPLSITERTRLQDNSHLRSSHQQTDLDRKNNGGNDDVDTDLWSRVGLVVQLPQAWMPGLIVHMANCQLIINEKSALQRSWRPYFADIRRFGCLTGCRGLIIAGVVAISTVM